MKTNSMKTHLTISLVVVCLTLASSKIAAQEKKGETLHGVVESVDGNTDHRQLPQEKPRLSRCTDKTARSPTSAF